MLIQYFGPDTLVNKATIYKQFIKDILLESGTVAKKKKSTNIFLNFTLK